MRFTVANAAGGLALLGMAGCSCQPGIDQPTDPVDTQVTEPPQTGPTGDTAPPSPCAVPEVEPNGTPDEATVLPKEQVGCGVFGAALDIDVFTTEVVEDGWLSVAVVAWGMGSPANPQLWLTSPEGIAAVRENDTNSQDAGLLFPAAPGQWNVTLSEENAAFGDDFYYEVVVSTAKPPVEWTVSEVEPNDSSAQAQELTDGSAVFGDREDNLDTDWYKVVVPTGKHTVTIDVEAHYYGSGGDYSLWLYNSQLQALPENCVVCEHRSDPVDLAILDPRVVYTSEGDETLYFSLSEVNFLWGPVSWYVVRIDLEAS